MKKNKKQDKKIPVSSFKTENEIYEMVYDKYDNSTSFFKITRDGEFRCFVDEFTHEGKTYVPLPPDHELLSKDVILFPSAAMDYGSEDELLEEIRSFIHKYLDVSENFEHIAAYYVLFSWLFDQFNEVPYLRALGDFGSGKSRFLQTIGSICYKPIFTGGATTTAPIFRIINEVKGTLIIDEADFRFSDMSAEIIKILNTGYQKGTAVLRCEGQGAYEVKAYDVYCPKIIGTREKFKDKALESRFLIEEMGSENLRADIPLTLEKEFYRDAEMLRNKLLMWRLKNYFQPIKKSTIRIPDIHPRLNQIIIPLLSIIKDELTQRDLIKFITAYNQELTEDRGLSWESDIILAILQLQHETKESEVTVGDIAARVNENADLQDENLTPKKVGWFLRSKLQLKPYKTRNGFVLNFKKDESKLDMWRKRFGVTLEDITGEDENIVNDVNDTQNAEDISWDSDQE